MLRTHIQTNGLKQVEVNNGTVTQNHDQMNQNQHQAPIISQTARLQSLNIVQNSTINSPDQIQNQNQYLRNKKNSIVNNDNHNFSFFGSNKTQQFVTNSLSPQALDNNSLVNYGLQNIGNSQQNSTFYRKNSPPNLLTPYNDNYGINQNTPNAEINETKINRNQNDIQSKSLPNPYYDKDNMSIPKYVQNNVPSPKYDQSIVSSPKYVQTNMPSPKYDQNRTNDVSNKTITNPNADRTR